MFTNEGMADIWNVYFDSGTQTTTFYIGLISNLNFKGLNHTDTMADHSGWVELEDYSEASRPTIALDTRSAGKVSNAATVVFTHNADAEVAGYFICTSNTKGGTTGTLIATVKLGSPIKKLNTETTNTTAEF